MKHMKHSKFTVGLVMIALTASAMPAAAQLRYSYEALPEPVGTTASEPHGISTIDDGTPAPSRYMIAGRVIDATGLSRAVAWAQAAGGAWGVELLPVTNPSADSDAWAVDSFFDVDYWSLAAGSTGDPATPAGQQPAAWTCTGNPCTWVQETVVIASGYTGGAARRVVHSNPGSIFLTKACGFLTDASGGTKAVVWTRDAASLAWQPTLLPGLVDPDPGSTANSMETGCCFDGTQIGWAIVGAAVNSGEQSVPVRWSCDSSVDDCTMTASWSITPLPFLASATGGEAVALPADKTVDLVAIACNQDVGGGGTTARRGGAYTCDEGSDDCSLSSSWNLLELPPLPGYANSQAFGIKEDGVNIIAGGSSDNGAGTEVATDWIVDRSVAPPTVSVFDVNNLVVNLPSNVALKKKGDFKDTIDIIIKTNKGLYARNALAPYVGNAAVLTDVPASVPAIAPSGMIAMALLLLAVGVLLVNRRSMDRTPT